MIRLYFGIYNFPQYQISKLIFKTLSLSFSLINKSYCQNISHLFSSRIPHFGKWGYLRLQKNYFVKTWEDLIMLQLLFYSIYFYFTRNLYRIHLVAVPHIVLWSATLSFLCYLFGKTERYFLFYSTFCFVEKTIIERWQKDVFFKLFFRQN